MVHSSRAEDIGTVRRSDEAVSSAKWAPDKRGYF